MRNKWIKRERERALKRDRDSGKERYIEGETERFHLEEEREYNNCVE